MGKQSEKRTFLENLNLRKRQLEADLAKGPDAATRDRLVQQLKEIESARHMEG